MFHTVQFYEGKNAGRLSPIVSADMQTKKIRPYVIRIGAKRRKKDRSTTTTTSSRYYNIVFAANS